MKLSLKYGFLGLGMGGCSIANECASIRLNVKNNMVPYTAFLINTNEVDLRKLPDRPNTVKYPLSGYERGAGRDITVGEEAFQKHKDQIAKKVTEYFSDRDFVFVVCGLGGGTGTGAVIEAIRLLHANGFGNRSGLILTLPRDQEGFQVLQNAIARLQVISRALRGLGSIILVDNQKLFNSYMAENPNANVTTFLDHSNRYIAQTLHELNIATANFNPLSGYHFDGSELLNMLREPGVLIFAKCTLDEAAVDAENQGTYLHKITQSIDNGVLSTGYDYATAARTAISIIASPGGGKRIFSFRMLSAIEKQLVAYAPAALEYPVATYADDATRQLTIYTMFAGLNFPRRISELLDIAKKYEQPIREDDVFSALNDFQIRKNENKVDLESALVGKAPKAQAMKDNRDPFIN